MSNSTRSRVLIATSTFGQADATPLEMLRDAGIDAFTNPYGRKLSRSEVTQLLAEDVVGLIAGLESLDREILTASHLKVISRVGAGMSNVDQEAAGELGILVYSTPDAPTNAVAELTVGALLSLLRDIPAMDRSVHGGGWEKRLGMEVQGRTVAIVGFGRIGRRLAELLTPFGATIVAVDPRFDETAAGYPILPLDEALRRADVVSVHVSGDECILDTRALSLMRDGGLVLNASRGGVIDEQALIGALEKGRIAGAWIDTFDEEPYTGPLRAYPQVLLTPHVGSFTAESRIQMEREAVENLINGLAQASPE